MIHLKNRSKKTDLFREPSLPNVKMAKFILHKIMAKNDAEEENKI